MYDNFLLEVHTGWVIENELGGAENHLLVSYSLRAVWTLFNIRKKISFHEASK